MNRARAEQIRDYWELLDDGDVSTEMLFSLVAAHFGIDNGDIAEALRITKEPDSRAQAMRGVH